MSQAVPKLTDLKPRGILIDAVHNEKKDTPSPASCSTARTEELPIYQQIFDKPLDALPCHKDLPRLVRQFTVEGEKIDKRGEGEEPTSVAELCKAILIRLNDEFGEREDLSNTIAQRYSEFVSESSTDELAMSLLKLFQQVMADSRVVRILKASNQSIIAPAMTRVKKLLEDAGLPFNSVRNGWWIHIERKWDEIVIKHCKRETATPEGESGVFGIPYNFEWAIAFTMDDDVRTVKDIQVDIKSAGLPAESEQPKTLNLVQEDEEANEDEVEFAALLTELIEAEFGNSKTQTQVLLKTMESKLKKIRTKRDKRIKKSKGRRKGSRIQANNRLAVSADSAQPRAHKAKSSSVVVTSNSELDVGSPVDLSKSLSDVGTPRKIGSLFNWLRKGSVQKESSDILELSNSNLEEVPEPLLTNNPLVREINLSNNFITSLNDATLKKLTEVNGFGLRLTHLNLSNNQLRTIPPEIKLLFRLTTLLLDHNHLQELPLQGLSALTDLTNLDLSFNRLRQLPNDLGSLTKLTTLNVEENPLLVFPPPEVVKAGTANILTYLSTNTKPTSLSSSSTPEESSQPKQQPVIRKVAPALRIHTEKEDVPLMSPKAVGGDSSPSAEDLDLEPLQLSDLSEFKPGVVPSTPPMLGPLTRSDSPITLSSPRLAST
eukprot:TRINITY_DN4400_c0_g1_i1.p1 TRINITY_DN4400_c0_g1~~TRINITY_DN4400_c0_g1_i1.p1  ORF type:complete len:659 (-),score=125.08 TRINITY_DN4400_c0_g1_i1:96-2072(-)